VVKFTLWYIGTYCIGSWVVPRTGPVAVRKRKFLPLSGTEPWSSSLQIVIILIHNAKNTNGNHYICNGCLLGRDCKSFTIIATPQQDVVLLQIRYKNCPIQVEQHGRSEVLVPGMFSAVSNFFNESLCLITQHHVLCIYNN
jgi:hypothetical protein